MDEIQEKIMIVLEKVRKTFEPALKEIGETFKRVFEVVTWNFSNNPEIKKFKGIYRRTKSGRIKKKQLTRINKILRRIYERR